MRCRSRFLAPLSDGRQASVLIDRGSVLRGGEVLETDAGQRVAVVAAPEIVSTVAAAEASELARLAYHLGNRHVPLQIAEGWVRYQHDHVLDDMARGLGFTVLVGPAPFEPEAGAYQGAGGAHQHAH
jgi:urease accessory protein